MTRKDFELIAASLRRAKPGSNYNPVPVTGGSEAQWAITCRLVCGELRNHNPRFNRERFLSACGLED